MKTKPLPLLRISSSLLLLALSGVTAKAQTTWNDPTTNPYWSTPGNWSNGVPTSATDVFFSGTGGNIQLNASVSNGFKSLKFNGNDSIYKLSSSSSTIYALNATASGFHVGYGATNSTLTIENITVSVGSGSFAYNGSGNTMVITGTGTTFTAANNAAFGMGNGNGSATANSGNKFTVQDGAVLNVGSMGVGGTGAGNTLIVTGTGSQLNVNGAGTNFDLTIGNTISTGTNSVKIVNGATAKVAVLDTKIASGSLVIGKGSSLSHTHATNVQTLRIGGRGTLYGAGSIIADVLRYDSSLSASGGTGAKVYIGETAAEFGKLSFTGAWQNSNITLNLKVGNLTGGAVAGTNYDLLDINGLIKGVNSSFVYGGKISIDLSGLVIGDVSELQVIHWTSASGVLGDLNVVFVGGNTMGYDVRADGLYLLPIPEPSSVMLLMVGVCGLGFGVWKNRKA